MRVLAVNAGSSSLKLRLLDSDDSMVAFLDLGRWTGRGETEQIECFVRKARQAGSIDAVGHRLVHGGAQFTAPTIVDARTRREIERLAELAPLHQPRAIAGIDAVAEVLPEPPIVACFDTAFHATLPKAAATYAIPHGWARRWGIRRYGFHGLSHAYAARRAAELLDLPAFELKLVTCHLGAGASLAAVAGGHSVDTTMGFTPLEGLVMATRSGSVDPGLLLWLNQRRGVAVDTLSRTLEHESGLAGFIGGSGDMRDVRRLADAGDRTAVLAFDVYVHRLRKEIAAMAAAMNGLDVLVFTGGVGEHQPPVRDAAGAGLGFLGVAVDADRNRMATGDTDISAPAARVKTLVITAREDIEIARLTRAALAGSNG